MDRELLIEIGTEEMPASWLPALTAAMGTTLEACLKAARLSADAPVETYSTPRRLTARFERISERQTDLEELITGPAVAAAFGADGQPTPAAVGFAKKQGVEVDVLERVEVADKKGVYLGFRKHQRGRAAIDVLPDVLTRLLRGLSFPKQMRWDALLDDGGGELAFGRPIRWLLFLYGGRVVPYTIFRTATIQSGSVQEVRAGAVTFGHRFLATSGRAGRAVKVKTFDDYRKRLSENFVVLERQERQDRISRELDVEARRRGGRVAVALAGPTLLHEVPDLVEYPVVISGVFAEEFLSLPSEILTTAMIHHQHFFPVVSDQAKLLPVFLAVLNTEPEKPEMLARNMERALTARLRDARFFWDADRRQPLEHFVPRLGTVLFHKKLGSYREKADRVSALAAWLCETVFERTNLVAYARTAGLLCKADLGTDMVRELTELQGTMGGIYAREDGHPEEVWKAIYHHYLPVGVEAAAPPSREQLGAAAITWAAVALADKLDTMVGMSWAGEKPTGSRDPYGLRRAMNGIMRILIDLRALTGLELAPRLGPLLRKAAEPFGSFHKWPDDLSTHFIFFVTERYSSALEHRGYDKRNVRAVVQSKAWDHLSPEHAERLLEALHEFSQVDEFQQLAVAFKRVRNLAAKLPREDGWLDKDSTEWQACLHHPAELALFRELSDRRQVLERAAALGTGYRHALSEAAALHEPIAKFFDEVLVMVEDVDLRRARLRLLWEVERVILKIADISQVVPDAGVKS